MREQVNDEHGVGNVSVGHQSVGVFRKHLGVERVGDEPREHQDEHRQDLQEPGENGGCLGVPLVLGGEHALHDHLVRAPIPDPQDGRAQEDPRPRKLGIADRFDHMKVGRRDRRAQSGKSSHFVQADERQHHRAGQQHQGLHHFRIDHGGQATGNGVNAGHDHQDDGRGQRVPAHHVLQHHRRRIQVHGNLRKDVRQDGDAGQVHGARTVEAAFEKFRHRKHVRPQVEGDEYPPEDEHHNARQPFEMADRQAGSGAGARQADEMLGGNVGDEQGGADGEPPNVPASQEIVFRGPFLAREVEADGENDYEVESDDSDVDRGQRPVRDRDLSCEGHSSVLLLPHRSLVDHLQHHELDAGRRQRRLQMHSWSNVRGAIHEREV